MKKKISTKGLVWKNPAMIGRSRGFRAMWHVYNSNALTYGRNFELSPDEFESIISRNCYYCGEAPRTRRWASIKGDITYNGIDRVDNTKGYTLTNVVPCCSTCNLWKKNKNTVDFLTHAEKVAAYQAKQKLLQAPPSAPTP